LAGFFGLTVMVFVTAVPPPLGVNVTVIVKRLRLEAFRAARPCARTTTVVKLAGFFVLADP
jgi:hypothetical protein